MSRSTGHFVPSARLAQRERALQGRYASYAVDFEASQGRKHSGLNDALYKGGSAAATFIKNLPEPPRPHIPPSARLVGMPNMGDLTTPHARLAAASAYAEEFSSRKERVGGAWRDEAEAETEAEAERDELRAACLRVPLPARDSQEVFPDWRRASLQEYLHASFPLLMSRLAKAGFTFVREDGTTSSACADAGLEAFVGHDLAAAWTCFAAGAASHPATSFHSAKGLAQEVLDLMDTFAAEEASKRLQKARGAARRSGLTTGLARRAKDRSRNACLVALTEEAGGDAEWKEEEEEGGEDRQVGHRPRRRLGARPTRGIFEAR